MEGNIFRLIKKLFGASEKLKCLGCSNTGARVLYSCTKCRETSCNACADVEDEDYGRIYCPLCGSTVEVAEVAAA